MTGDLIVCPQSKNDKYECYRGLTVVAAPDSGVQNAYRFVHVAAGRPLHEGRTIFQLQECHVELLDKHIVIDGYEAHAGPPSGFTTYSKVRCFLTLPGQHPPLTDDELSGVRILERPTHA